MQRFTLLHDGSEQGWQAAYLTFHFAARLGAPVLALLLDSTIDKNILAQKAAQIEIGGRAAGITIETRLMKEFSQDVLAKHAANTDGLFVPHNLIDDRKTALLFLEALACPLWIVSQGSEMREMAILVDDLSDYKTLINYAISLSYRTQQPLTGFIRTNELASVPNTGKSVVWVRLPDSSDDQISVAIKQLDINLLFLPVSYFYLLNKLPVNCVVFPAVEDA